MNARWIWIVAAIVLLGSVLVGDSVYARGGGRHGRPGREGRDGQNNREKEKREEPVRQEEGDPNVKWPQSVFGFSGEVFGIVLSKRNNGTFTFKVEKVNRIWESNRASRPKDLIGKTINIGYGTIKKNGNKLPNPYHLKFIQKLRVKEDYRLEIKHLSELNFLILELNEDQREMVGMRREGHREGGDRDREGGDQKREGGDREGDMNREGNREQGDREGDRKPEGDRVREGGDREGGDRVREGGDREGDRKPEGEKEQKKEDVKNDFDD